MLISARWMLVLVSGLVVTTGVVLLFLGHGPGEETTAPRTLLAVTLIATGFIGGIILLAVARPAKSRPERESDDITKMGDERLRELMRGTSLYLREMRYRYSVRIDTKESPNRRRFSAEVNTIRLGFIPSVITDNTNDRQGYGFVAFVFDGKRWRGPGLPCPPDQADAVRHAGRCVSPLATEEETNWDG